MTTYCEGSRCEKKDKCALHCVGPGDYYYIDWSVYGGGHCWADEEGKSHIETWIDCGIDGNYKNFVPLKE